MTMTATLSPHVGRTLADIRAGDRVIVRRNLLDELSIACPDLALRSGDRVACVGDSPMHLELETPAGARLLIDRFFACFVETETAQQRFRRVSED